MVIKSTLPLNLSSLLAGHPAFKRLLGARQATAEGSATPVSHPLPLPENLRHKVLVQDTGNHMLLLVPNNAVAQILRFHLPKLKSQLGHRNISIRIQADLAAAVHPQTPADRHIDPTTAAALNSLADHCDHAPLADALRRIASLAED